MRLEEDILPSCFLVYQANHVCESVSANARAATFVLDSIVSDIVISDTQVTHNFLCQGYFELGIRQSLQIQLQKLGYVFLKNTITLVLTSYKQGTG
jgi:hypothetical protein